MSMKCRLKVYTGLMGSGKSRRLIEDYYSNTGKGKKIAVLPDNLTDPENEQRKTSINSRNPLIVDIKNFTRACDIVGTELIADGKGIFIYIDEAQFLTREQFRYFLNLASSTRILVYVTMSILKSDFRGLDWENMTELKAWYADKDNYRFPDDSLEDLSMKCELCLGALNDRKDASNYLDATYKFRSDRDMPIMAMSQYDYDSAYERVPDATRIMRLTNETEQVVFSKDKYASVCDECSAKIELEKIQLERDRLSIKDIPIIVKSKL